jgi:uncharacterized protein (TIGR02757 family)
MTRHQTIKKLLDQKYKQYNTTDFIQNDPVCIPHLFTQKQDIEIMGFFASIFAWGQRVTIINKCKELIERMDHAPHDFVLHHTDNDLKKLLGFKHRTFNDTDLLYCIHFFKYWYSKNQSLETAFSKGIRAKDTTIENGLITFRNHFFSLDDAPQRTYKHIASPAQHSACKRLNMYLRWMVRQDNNGVDFGIWTNIKPAQLVCPLDVHVQRVATKLGLLQRIPNDWQAALELTKALKQLDKNDPVKYDFALFGLGIMDKF